VRLRIIGNNYKTYTKQAGELSENSLISEIFVFISEKNRLKQEIQIQIQRKIGRYFFRMLMLSEIF
jgi:hypothetical protein